MSAQVPKRHVKAWINVRVRDRGISAEQVKRLVREAVRATYRDARATVGTLTHGDLKVVATGRCLTLGDLRVCHAEEFGYAYPCPFKDAKTSICFDYIAEVASIEPSPLHTTLEEAVRAFLKRGRRVFGGVFSLPTAVPPVLRDRLPKDIFESVRHAVDFGVYLTSNRYSRWGFGYVHHVPDVVDGVVIRYNLYTFSMPPLRVHRARGCSVALNEREIYATDCFAEDLFDVFVIEPQTKTLERWHGVRLRFERA